VPEGLQLICQSLGGHTGTTTHLGSERVLMCSTPELWFRQLLVLVVVCLGLTSSRLHAQSAGTIVGAWVHVPTEPDTPALDSIVFRSNGTYSQWLYITSTKPQRLDGRWTRSGKRYRIEHSGAGDSFVLKEGYLILGDEEGAIRGYRRIR
jgi:hypothetical protein